MTALLVPSLSELAGWAGVGFAALVFIGLGRVLSDGRAAPETALIAGWGAACLVLTLWGVATAASLRLPAWALAVVGMAGLLLPRRRLDAAEWRGIFRILAVSLPLLAVMASARPSQPDTFLNLLPNAAYVYDHGFFPADGRPPAHSELPGAPYNLQLAALAASLVTPGFPANALIGFNLVLQLAAGLLLARLAGDAADDHAAPSWGMAALGVLLATALNPGFVPRYHLSGYTETPVTVALAFAGWLVARRPAGVNAWLLALCLAALVETKQDSVALAGGIVMAAAALPFAGETRRRALARAAAAAAPAAVLYLAWRWYLATHFDHPAELTMAPIGAWDFSVLPALFAMILRIVTSKIVFFAPLAAVLAAFFWRLRRGLAAPGMREAAVLLLVAAIYNAALLVSYVGHFTGQMAADAHSYFRYDTHLALLLVVVLTAMLREPVHAWITARAPGLRRALSAAALVALLACPAVFIGYLRFDLEAPQRRAWDLAHAVAARIGPEDRVGLILPGDNNTLSAVLQGLLRLTPPRRPDITVDVAREFASDTLASLAGDRWAVLSCAPPGIDGVAAGQGALFENGPEGWRIAATWAYAPASSARVSRVIALAPLCL